MALIISPPYLLIIVLVAGKCISGPNSRFSSACLAESTQCSEDNAGSPGPPSTARPRFVGLNA